MQIFLFGRRNKMVGIAGVDIYKMDADGKVNWRRRARQRREPIEPDGGRNLRVRMRAASLQWMRQVAL